MSQSGKSSKSGNSTGQREKTAQELNQALRDRKTTVPSLTGTPDPGRPAKGPPKEGVEKLVSAVLNPDYADLHLIELVTQEQLRQDRAASFKEEDQYVRTTAIMANDSTEIYKEYPWTGGDLLYRNERTFLLERAGMAFLRFGMVILNTAVVEKADQIRMADMMVNELEAQSKRPILDEARRADYLRRLEMPMQIWEARQQQILQNRGDNARKDDRLQQALDLIAELTAGGTDSSHQAGTPPPPPGKHPLPVDNPAHLPPPAGGTKGRPGAGAPGARKRATRGNVR